VSFFQYVQGVLDHRVGLVVSWRVVVSCHRCLPYLIERLPVCGHHAGEPGGGHVPFRENRGRAPSSSCLAVRRNPKAWGTLPMWIAHTIQTTLGDEAGLGACAAVAGSLRCGAR